VGVGEELERQAGWHAIQADAFAERSHEVSADLGDAYSSLAEAHREVSEALKRKAGK